MRHPDEPHVVIGDELVHVGAVSMLQSLVASGHRVARDPHGEVTVDPLSDLADDQRYLLEAFAEDLEILLDDLTADQMSVLEAFAKAFKILVLVGGPALR